MPTPKSLNKKTAINPSKTSRPTNIIVSVENLETYLQTMKEEFEEVVLLEAKNIEEYKKNISKITRRHKEIGNTLKVLGEFLLSQGEVELLEKLNSQMKFFTSTSKSLSYICLKLAEKAQTPSDLVLAKNEMNKIHKITKSIFNYPTPTKCPFTSLHHEEKISPNSIFACEDYDEKRISEIRFLR